MVMHVSCQVRPIPIVPRVSEMLSAVKQFLVQFIKLLPTGISLEKGRKPAIYKETQPG